MGAPGRLQFRFQLIADQLMHGTVGQSDFMRVRQVLLHLSITTKAADVRELLMEFGQDVR